MSNVDNEFDMTEDFSIHMPSREKSNSSHDSSVWTDRSDDRPIYPKLYQNKGRFLCQWRDVIITVCTTPGDNWRYLWLAMKII